MPISIRFHRKHRAALAIPDAAAAWDTYRVVLRDSEGGEHHFGFPEPAGSGKVFTFVASYTEEGREPSWSQAQEKLAEEAFDVVEPTRGPALKPVVQIAMQDLADYAIRKGFAFDEERGLAVQILGALVRANEPIPPEEIYVFGATHGYRPKDANRLREYAQRAIEGRGTREVGGRALKVDPHRADMMAQRWREESENAA